MNLCTIIIITFILVTLMILTTINKKCKINNGGYVIDRPAKIISMTGKTIIDNKSFPTNIILQYPNKQINLTIKPGGIRTGGMFGKVVEYHDINSSKEYMVKSQNINNWTIEKKWWIRLTPQLKSLFTETYFVDPKLWHINPPVDTQRSLLTGRIPSRSVPNYSFAFSDYTAPPPYESPPLTAKPAPDSSSAFSNYTVPLQSENLVRRLDSSNIHEGIIVMAKYDGSLSNLLHNPSLNVTNVKSIIRQIVRHLLTFKDSNLLYSDLKLDNIVYEQQSQTYIIKFIDIGSLCKRDNCKVLAYIKDGPAYALSYGSDNAEGLCQHTYYFTKTDREIFISRGINILSLTCDNYFVMVCGLMLYQLISNSQNAKRFNLTSLLSNDFNDIYQSLLYFRPLLLDIQNNLMSLENLINKL